MPDAYRWGIAVSPEIVRQSWRIGLKDILIGRAEEAAEDDGLRRIGDAKMDLKVTSRWPDGEAKEYGAVVEFLAMRIERTGSLI